MDVRPFIRILIKLLVSKSGLALTGQNEGYAGARV